MSDYQDFLDDPLLFFEMPEAVEEPVYEEYDIFTEIRSQLVSMRSAKKMTQKELAKKCGLTQANISNIEKGISKPTLDTLKKMADAMGKRLRVEFDERNAC